MSNHSVQVSFETGDNSLSENFTVILDFITFNDKSFPTPHVALIAVYVVLIIILETLGNFLLFCLILYEKYGMDSRKRTVTNQLLSSMCVAQILCNIFIMPLFTLTMIIGPQSKLSLR